MKKVLLAAVLLTFFSSFLSALTLVQKSETSPEFILSGHVWGRYSIGYIGENISLNRMSLERNYITMKLNGADYNSNITLDIVNREAAQKSGDFQVWVKMGYLELTKLPLLSDAGINLRAGIQLMYTGTNPVWKYNLYEVPVEGRAGLSSADMGIALIGTALEKRISYEVAMYSGDGFSKLDGDVMKALCGNVKVNIIDNLNLILTYYNKAGVNSMDKDPFKRNVSELVLTYSNGMLSDSYAMVMEKTGPRAAGKSGVMQVFSVYAGIKPFDLLSIHARFDLENTDTAVANDEIYQYYAGLLIPVAEKVNLMLDYSLKQKKGAINDNLFIAQAKWDW